MADIKSMFANMSNGGGGDDGTAGESSAPKLKGKKPTTIEETYQKKSQLEHILLRPDTYIGSVEKVSDTMWIYDGEKQMMIQKQIEYVPGLYKIFDEILVNAADNKQRDKKMDCIKIEIKPEENRISVWNNGQGIPVAMHKDENMFVPTMIFGHLLTSSNYNDEEEKVTGGRNGYGAKLCNIFSDKFIVETACKQYKKEFKQIWGSNMSKASEPKIKAFGGEDYTKITFHPDLKKFKMEKLDDDIVGLMSRRAYDIAASTRGVKVFLNGERLPVKTFKDYVDLFIKGKEDEMGNNLKVVYESPNERWEVAVTLSDRGFQQMSFVNSIATTKGGRHVDYVTDLIVKQLLDTIKKKNKGGTSVKPFQVKNHMWVFVNCLIVNPTFDSQTKENMTLQMKSFGSKCNLSEKFINQVQKSGIVETVLSWAKFKQQNELVKASAGKKTSKLKGVPKLEDANDAGTKNALKCTLILTEGDSAKSLAVSGLSVIGRDHYGVFPLKGKLLNVREATHKQILENAEINNLVKIIGLQYKKKYNTREDMKMLRYGKVMIMTDQDQDGSHIKGLLINFIHYNWPELLRLDFLEEFITPIVKAKKKNQELSFYSLPEFEEWKKDTPNHHTYGIKYYKGLGTSTSKEAKEYFSNMDRHRIIFRYNGQQDDDHIELAFSKKHVEARKEWLTKFMRESKERKEMGLPERYLYTKDTKAVNYKDFVNLELVLFSNADNIRSIPCLVDGLKPGQRKVLYTCMKRNDKKEVKVAQLAGSVAEHSAYHHGEASLCLTIVNLAQNYVGSNNINLLEPRGQFGTRLAGGKDSASPRYIFTKMSPLTRMIFHPNDDALLKHEYDDNQKIEPEWYMPIIPMVLVNGADGIGTGWMTKIPNYNPRELVECIRAMLDDEEPRALHPWYKNFKGTIELCAEQRYCVSGEISIIGNQKAEITELPIGTWTQNYKENTMEAMLNGTDKSPAVLTDYKEYNTDTQVRFIATPQANQMATMEKEGWHKVFKLQTVISTTSMVCFDELGCICRFDSVMEILQSFYALRLKYYKKRKDYMTGMLEAEAQKLSNQARFIMEKCNGTLTVENKKRKAIVEELIKRGYHPDPVYTWKTENLKDAEDETQNEEEEEEDDSEATTSKSKKPVDPEKAFKNLSEVKKFDYLLGLSMWMLTEEKKNELLRQRDVKIAELEALKRKTEKDLWRDDLDTFILKLDQVEEKERKDELGVKKEKTVGKKAIKRESVVPMGTGERIVPVVSEELKKKVQNAIKTKENKGKRAVKKEPIEIDEDEFDVMVKDKRTLEDKLQDSKEKKKKTGKAGTDGLKQTKLNFDKKAANGAEKKRGGGSGKKKPLSDDEDGDVKSDSDSSFEANVPASPVKERSNVRRAKANKIVYKLDDSSDKSSDDEVLHDNVLVKEDKKPAALIMDDSEEDEPPPTLQQSSEDLFDSLVGSSTTAKRALDSDSEDDFKPQKKQPAKAKEEKPKKPRAKKKKMDSDFEEEKPKKTKTKAKKSFDSSGDNLSDDSSVGRKPVASRPGRGAAKKTYAISDDDYSD